MTDLNDEAREEPRTEAREARRDDPRLGGRAISAVVFDEVTIRRRVHELGAEITQAYPDGELLVIGVLKGSALFIADLIRTIERPLTLDFLTASSYGAGTTSSGVVDVIHDPRTRLDDKHVLLVEDIVDSGRTLAAIVTALNARRPRSVAVCALLHKRLTPLALNVQFVGFDAPNVFLVGYGLDHAEHFRHLPYIVSVE